MISLRLAALAAVAVLASCSRGGDPAARSAENSGGVPTEASAQGSDPEVAQKTDAPRGKARGLPAGAIRAQRVQIMDANGFEQPLPAMFALIPVGWRAQGGVQWGRQFMCTNGYNFNWFAQSADGQQTVAILPQQKWEANNYGAGPSSPGCPSASIGSIQQYLQVLVGQLRPGARVTDFRPRPDLAANYRNLNQSTPTAMGEMRTWVEAGEALFVYSEQGREMRGVVAAAAAFSLMRSRGLNPGQTMDAMTGFVFPGFAATGPSGEFNPQLAETIRQSFLPNPAWQAEISRHNAAISRVAAEEIRKQGQAISEYNDYVSLLRRQVSDARAQSDEKRQREFGEVIKGVQTYDDSSAAGGRMELSSLYDHAWRLNDGTYVLSNDAGFEPFRDLGVEGSPLQKTQ
ncbi:MAG: hypothetical protein ABI885_15335 [Gammaproteobacteria bacterium]